MKKLLFILPLMAMLWSCKKNPEGMPDKSAKDFPKTYNPLAARDGVYDLLGYGYDLNGDFGVSSSAKFAVLDISKFVTEHPDRYNIDLAHTSTSDLTTSSSAETYLNLKTQKVGAAASFGDGTKTTLFKGTLNLAFNDTLSWSSKYIFSSYNLYIQRKHLSLNAPASLLQGYLAPAFVADLNSQTPAYIVSHYGTHVLTDIMLGAVLNVTYRSQTRNSSRYSASAIGVKAAVGKVFSINVNDTTSTSTDDIRKNFDQTLHAVTHGGDPAQTVIATIPLDSSVPTPINVTPWQNSCTDANAEMVNIGNNGLIKLSDFVTDPTKKAALSAYIDSYLINAQVHINATNVYDFYSSSLFSHYYSVDQYNNSLYPGSGYASNGSTFSAYATPRLAETAVPVYQFFDPATGDHGMTTDRYPAWPTYNYDGVVFYAFTTNVAGTVPVYEFYLKTPKIGSGGRPIPGQYYVDHFFSTNRNANAGTSYTYVKIAFYAYPN